MPANTTIHHRTVTNTLSLDGDPADTPAFADKTFQLLYAAAPMGDEANTDDNELLIALRHPLRRQILRAMVEAEPISPREIADELKEPLSNVSYHVRVLADCGGNISLAAKQLGIHRRSLQRKLSKYPPRV